MSETGYRIRRFREEDLTSVMDINHKCLPENYPAFFYLELYRRAPEAFLVAEMEGERVVGYMMCRLEGGFSSFGFLKGLAKKGHVGSLAVLQEFRRKGLGTALMVKGMKALKEIYQCEECFLEVRTTNKDAIRVYERLGLVVVKRVHGYYRDGEDAYTMSIKL